MNIPLISIIVPIYKVPENYLRQCIESCINQTMQEIEIILVDDGSPDNCGIICDEYASIDNRIKVVHKMNEGLAAARNTGQNNAKGTWIMFVDGDDWIEKEMCISMLTAAHSKGDVELVMCEWVKDYGNHLSYYQFPFTDGQTFEREECITLLGKMLDFNNNLGTVPAKLYKKDFLNKFQIKHDEEFKQGVEGIIFNLKVFSKQSSAIFLKKPFYHYLYNADSITGLMSNKTIRLLLGGLNNIDIEISKHKEREHLEFCFKTRVLSAIISSVLRGIFSPQNNYTYEERKKLLNEVLEEKIVKKYIHMDWHEMPIQKRVLLCLIRNKLYALLNISGKLRNIHLSLKRL